MNPYQPPRETPTSPGGLENPSAQFQLTRRQIRFAESKFMLYRCSGRLVLASMVMIVLAFLVSYDGSGMSLTRGGAARFRAILIYRELAVMAVATVVYLGLIHGVRGEVRRQLVAHGVVPNVGISVDLKDSLLRWTSVNGTFTSPIDPSRIIRTGKGLVILVGKDLFWFIPKQSDFAGLSYRDVVRKLEGDTDASRSPG